VKEYLDATVPELAFGEYWDTCEYTDGVLNYNQDAHRQRTVNWCDRTGGTSAAFDFTTKGRQFCPSREKLSQMSCMYLFTCPAKEAEKSPQLHAACIPEQTPIVFGREICMCLQQEWDLCTLFPVLVKQGCIIIVLCRHIARSYG